MGRGLKSRALAVLLSGAIAASIAVVVSVRIKAPAEDHAVALVPAEATGYVHGFAKPSTDQRKALRDLLALFPAADDEDEVERAADAFLREILGNLGLDFRSDITGWLGDEVAAFTLDGATGILLSVEDEERATAAIAEASSPGYVVDVVDDFVVVGDEAAVSAVAPSPSASLAGVERYQELMREVASHRILSFFGTDGALPARTLGLPLPAPLRSRAGPPAAASLSVRADSVVVDVVGSEARPPSPTGVSPYPADLTFALALEDGDPITAVLLSPFQTFAPRSATAAIRLGIADVDADIEVDMATRRAAVETSNRLRRFFDEDLRQDIRDEGAAFSFDPGFLLPEVRVSTQRSRLRLRAGETSVAGKRATLGDDPRVTRSLGGESTPLMFLDLGSVPGPLRSFALRQASLAPAAERVIERLLTLNLGVRQLGGYEAYRAVATFDAR